jgi:hypothetical protein
MLIQLFVGSAVSALNIILHACVTMIAMGAARSAARRSSLRPLVYLAGVMITTSLALMAAHTLEVFVWSVAYAIVNAAPDDANLVYFAFVNYTTLGYGDVTPLAKWRLLGPMTAMNGVLMFGWSTALMFEVLLKTMERSTAFTPAKPDEAIGPVWPVRTDRAARSAAVSGRQSRESLSRAGRKRAGAR